MAKWTAERARIKPLVRARLKEAGGEDRLLDLTCCALACVSYKADAAWLRNSLPTGWRFLDEISGAAGYDAAALLHTRTKTLVILNRGTELANDEDDFMQNAAAIFSGEDHGQVQACLDYLADMWSAHGARASEIKAVGHSLGGGLAEAQVYLGAAAISARGKTPPLNIFGIGIASAGYGRVIRNVAAQRSYAVNEDASDVTHYVRRKDVTETIKLADRLGSVQRIGSIFHAGLERAPGPRTRYRWEPRFDTIHNHDCSTYFEHFGVGAEDHVWWRWKSRKYERREGAEPAPFPQLQVPAGDL